MSNGIGGDVMAIVYNPTDKRLYGYNGSGKSSKLFTYDQMKTEVEKQFDSSYIPLRGPLSITVPGALQGWCDLHDRFGKLPFEELFTDAIEYANNGFAVTQIIASYWKDSVESFNQSETKAEITTNNQYPKATEGFLNIYTFNGSEPICI